jgi:hypothetical protein
VWHLDVLRVGGLIGRVLLAVGPGELFDRRQEYAVDGSLHHAVQRYHRHRTRLRLGARAGGGFLLAQHASESERRTVEARWLATRLAQQVGNR